jgi:peptidoglycan hydrolase-like protein with peptidoglycan-binding domain
MLIFLGFDIGEADGKFGANTERAVKVIQTKRGLVPDGKVGPLTKKAIEEEVKAKKERDQESGSITSVEDPEYDGFISSFLEISPS